MFFKKKANINTFQTPTIPVLDSPYQPAGQISLKFGDSSSLQHLVNNIPNDPLNFSISNHPGKVAYFNLVSQAVNQMQTVPSHNPAPTSKRSSILANALYRNITLEQASKPDIYAVFDPMESTLLYILLFIICPYLIPKKFV